MWDGGLAWSGGMVCGGGGTLASQAKGFSELVAGEETRSRETGENAEMAARHLVPFGTALGAGNPEGTSCGHDSAFHGVSAFGGEYTAYG
jgi:hypothetical protein